MFQKLVAIEPVNLTAEGKARLSEYAAEVVLYDDIPASDEVISQRIGDADCVLVSYTSRINGDVLKAAPNLKYVGMCCSLYSEKAANVDIATARELGITVKGVRDYGDQGVVEYVISQLVSYLQGHNGKRYEDKPIELASIHAGIVGLGTTGTMIADALRFFGTPVSYYSRTRKPECEERGIAYLPLHELLAQSQVVFLCLNKNVILMGEEEFKALGCDVQVTTVDGSYGTPGFVTTPLAEMDYSYFYTCGPEPMLKAVYKASKTSGQMSFEERMGCGFGACMGCSCKTLTGYKRICKDGPVMRKEEILWKA